MAENSIANCHWKACDTCDRGKEEGGCEVDGEVFYELETSSDTIVCLEYQNYSQTKM